MENLVKTQDTALANYDYGQDAGAGFEGQDAADITIPFLAVLQSNSPQVADGDATAGQLYNTVTEETFDEVTIVPAFTERVFVEFVPREQGGGFKGVHAPNSAVVRAAIDGCKEFGKYNTPDGNQLVETFTVYGVQLDDSDEVIGMITMGFTSMKIKVYKKWNTRVRSFQLNVGGRRVSPPLYAHKVVVSTDKQKNSKGTFFNVALSPAGGKLGVPGASLLSPDSSAFQAAKDCGDLVKKGIAKAGHVADDTSDEEVPF